MQCRGSICVEPVLEVVSQYCFGLAMLQVCSRDPAAAMVELFNSSGRQAVERGRLSRSSRFVREIAFRAPCFIQERRWSHSRGWACHCQLSILRRVAPQSFLAFFAAYEGRSVRPPDSCSQVRRTGGIGARLAFEVRQPSPACRSSLSQTGRGRRARQRIPHPPPLLG